jgi:translocation and assembly module TamA
MKHGRSDHRRRRLPQWLAAVLLLAACSAASAARLELSGLDDALLANVEAFIGQPEEYAHMPPRVLAQYVRRQATDALQAMGYYAPAIDIERTADGGDTILRVHVVAGEPVRIGATPAVTLPEDAAPELKAFLAGTLPRQGDVFNHGAYEKFRDDLLQRARMLGYFDARWTAREVRIDPPALRADITLALDCGPRYRIGDITVRGNGLDEGMVRRFPRFASGDWYDARTVALLQQELMATGWLESVRLRAEPLAGDAHLVPVEIDYTLRMRNRIGVGVGASTDTGPRVQLLWEKPWLNAQGESLQAYTEVGEEHAEVEATWIVPRQRNPRDEQFAWSYGLEQQDRNAYEYWLTSLGGELRSPLGERWRMARSLELEQETDEYGLTRTRSTLVMPGIAFTRRMQEGAPLVRNGYRLYAKAQVAGDAVLSDADMVRLQADARLIVSLADRMRLLLRGGLGGIATPDFEEIPLSLRFFAGGDQSVRGYDYESISPLDEQFIPVGARGLLDGSVELDWRFADRWLAAVFVDQGTAFNDLADADIYTGVGTGIRWVSPIGPVRLDIAAGITPDEPVWNLHFYMGPEL